VLGEIVGWEFLLVIAVAALLFGSSQIPKLAKSVGQASKEFRKGLEEGAADDDTPAAKPAKAEGADPSEPGPGPAPGSGPAPGPGSA
jgi:sec-independent protein translocase protein TatA